MSKESQCLEVKGENKWIQAVRVGASCRAFESFIMTPSCAADTCVDIGGEMQYARAVRECVKNVEISKSSMLSRAGPSADGSGRERRRIRS